MCMNRCQQLMDKFDRRTQMKYFQPRFEPPGSQKITFDPNTFRGALDWRNRYRRLANQCVNYELKRQYALMAYTTVEYCTTNRRPEEESPITSSLQSSPGAFDEIDVAFLVLLAMLLILTVVSTAYDCHQYHRTKPCSGALFADGLKDYYRSGFERPGHASRCTL
uniref:Uncharacterized protein n=1 Tax=Anopheles farauti TaxID=69004 RepID=A0A182QVE1_9DIPT